MLVSSQDGVVITRNPAPAHQIYTGRRRRSLFVSGSAGGAAYLLLDIDRGLPGGVA
jgi:hypothetical protein